MHWVSARGAERYHSLFWRVYRGGVPGDTAPVGVPDEQPVPEGLDYDLWLGPAPEKPYTELRVHPPRDIDGRPGWLRISDYAQGTNWGSHLNDIAQWANRSDRSGPVRVEGSGTFSEGLWDTIERFACRYEYANGVKLEYDMGGAPGIEFHGAEGRIKVGYPDAIEASDPAVLRSPEAGEADYSTILTDKEDFLKAIHDGIATHEPFEVGHRTVSPCQLGLVAVQTGKALTWDPGKEQFVNDESANALLTRETRGNWMQ